MLAYHLSDLDINNIPYDDKNIIEEKDYYYVMGLPFYKGYLPKNTKIISWIAS